MQTDAAPSAYRSEPLLEIMNFCVVTLPAVDDTVLAPCMFEGKFTVQAVTPVPF